MANSTRHFFAAALCAAPLAAMPAASHADTRLVSFTHFGGVLGMGASDISLTSYLQGVHRRDERNIKFTGSVLGALQKLSSHGDQGTSDIVIDRVDDNLHLTLKPADKTYSEAPLYKPHDSSAAKSSKGGTSKDEEDDSKITKNDLEIKATGKSQDINGFECKEYMITWDVETENTKTGEKGKSLMTADTWYSEDPRFKAVIADEATFSRAYLKLMHLDVSADQLREFGFGQITVSGSPDTKLLFDKLHKLQGFPVSTDVKWEANSTGQQKDANGQPQPTSSGAGLAALSSLLGNNQSQDQQNSGNGLTTIFTSHTEIKSVDSSALSSSLFTAPADYKQD